MDKIAKYECPRCGYSTPKKGNIRDHYKRKRPCKIVNKNVSLEYCLNLLDNIESKTDIVSELEEQVNFLKEQLVKQENEFKKQIETEKEEKQKLLDINKELSKKAGNNNTVNNITININAFKDTDYTHITNEIIKCLETEKGNVPMFEEMVKKLHFNKDFPENHNIYKPNVREDRILTFNGDSFIVDKTAVDTMLEKLENEIEKVVKDDHTKNHLIGKLKTHLKLKKTDCEYIHETKKDISTELYNGRDIVKQTHKK